MLDETPRESGAINGRHYRNMISNENVTPYMSECNL